MAEKDVHQRGLARAVLAQKGHDLAAPQRQRDAVIGEKRAEPLGDARKAEDDLLRPAAVIHQDDFGSVSSIVTVKLPARIAASRVATSVSAASGTLPSKVPSGASEHPPSFRKE